MIAQLRRLTLDAQQILIRSSPFDVQLSDVLKTQLGRLAARDEIDALITKIGRASCRERV